MKLRKPITLFSASLILLLCAGDISLTLTQTNPTPNPVLFFVGSEFVTIRGKELTRYRFNVENFTAYPNALFAAAPVLPPCGANTNASRTWVDIFDSHGKRLNGFCALGKASDLNQIWFALDSDVIPPSWIYIELNDRQTNTKYKSNLAETTL